MLSARVRLVFLWLSHVARTMANGILYLVPVLLLLAHEATFDQIPWHLPIILATLPAVVLAPVIGAICNDSSKPTILKASVAGASILILILLGVAHFWALTWAFVAITSTLHNPARTALLPAAAVDTRWPLSRINGLFEMGTPLAILIGYFWTVQRQGLIFHFPTFPLDVILVLYVVAMVTTWPVQFAADVRGPREQGLGGFFSDCTRIWSNREARVCLLGSALNWGLLAGFLATLVAEAVADRTFVAELINIGLWLFGGVALGSMLAGLQNHPRRVLGMVPWGAMGLTVGLTLIALSSTPGPLLSAFLGASFGLVNVPLSATYQAAVPPNARGNAMAFLAFAINGAMAAMAGFLWWLGSNGWTPTGPRWVLAVFALAAAVLAWKVFLRETIEQLLEVPLRFFYSVRGAGPGLDSFPQRGPLLVVANHSAWFDPVWLAKVLPRRLIPMMTSVFYDLPIMKWLMVYVARAIRVQAATFRRDVPEIQEAIDALDSGECVVVFPEGAMRRTEERPLRQFGQGIWHILKERPTTPVVVCWIEGGWGSYFSYFNGKPTKNKRMDWRRRIQVGVGPAKTVPSEILKDHRTTRAYFMQMCLEARRFLGLEPLSISQEEEENQSASDD